MTATLASRLVERVSADNATNQTATVAHVEELMAEIRALRDQPAVPTDGGRAYPYQGTADDLR